MKNWLSLLLQAKELIKLPFILSGVCSPSEANYCSNPFEVFYYELENLVESVLNSCNPELSRDSRTLVSALPQPKLSKNGIK